jgi:mannose-1-phosphate guanylyltransferase
VRNDPHAWAVILAGGDGTRLQALTRVISGDDRPKQFCPIFDGQTLLTQTRERLANAISRDRTAFVVVKPHERFYRDELSDVEPARMIVQPSNRGTAAGILYSLMRIASLDEDAADGFFPSDHYYGHEAPFLHAVHSAFALARENNGAIVLLGAEPKYPEVEYGWIEPGTNIRSPFGDCSRVIRFWEKPPIEVATELQDRGCLWNTFIMVGSVRTFLEAFQSSVPQLLDRFAQTCLGADTCWEDVRRLYRTIAATDFSHQVLSVCSDRLLVLRMEHAGWSDLGKPERVIATLATAGIKPPWAMSIGGAYPLSEKATA